MRQPLSCQLPATYRCRRIIVHFPNSGDSQDQVTSISKLKKSRGFRLPHSRTIVLPVASEARVGSRPRNRYKALARWRLWCPAAGFCLDVGFHPVDAFCPVYCLFSGQGPPAAFCAPSFVRSIHSDTPCNTVIYEIASSTYLCRGSFDFGSLYICSDLYHSSRPR